MPRLALQTPYTLTKNQTTGNAVWPAALGERDLKRLSWHTEFTDFNTQNPGYPNNNNPFRNLVSGRGPVEGRPPGEVFAHQRWDEFFPKVGYVMSWGQIQAGTKFHPGMTAQNPNAIWTYGPGRFVQGRLPPFLIKGRYGEPILTRIYNNTPLNREQNGGFGRNESQLHHHNAHNGAELDGAANVRHFPGTFYDYRWSTTLARRDTINTQATEPRASGPNGNGGLVNVKGDFRELQGTLWAHDHRFFFTAENVYKGNRGMVNYYQRPGPRQRRPGRRRQPAPAERQLLDYGNVDFDVNLMMSDEATTGRAAVLRHFPTDGFLGDLMPVNFAYAPYMNVLPRKYRFRILNACMSRFFQFCIASPGNQKIDMKFIANDGNFVVSPITLKTLDHQGSAERYDIVVDFSPFAIGSKLKLVNLLEMREDGRGPKDTLSLGEALQGDDDDPVIGPMLEFRVVGSVPSVDVPGVIHYSTTPDISQVPNPLTVQIPIVAPVRTRLVEFGRSGNGDLRGPNGQCTPDCPENMPFPWTIKINGQEAHSMNANRISLLIPQPGQVEHWTYVNGGGGWDHPIHLHFEEGITMNRGNKPIPNTELNVRKDVWRLRESGSVTFQVQFGEYGGSYVNHCHNTVHEDFAMLMRIQLLTGVAGSPQTAVTPTPNPSPDGVTFTNPEILPEGDPRT